MDVTSHNQPCLPAASHVRWRLGWPRPKNVGSAAGRTASRSAARVRWTRAAPHPWLRTYELRHSDEQMCKLENLHWIDGFQGYLCMKPSCLHVFYPKLLGFSLQVPVNILKLFLQCKALTLLDICRVTHVWVDRGLGVKSIPTKAGG
jgi:hypothetical protein